jgi:hypothetical protein
MELSLTASLGGGGDAVQDGSWPGKALSGGGGSGGAIGGYEGGKGGSGVVLLKYTTILIKTDINNIYNSSIIHSNIQITNPNI